MKKAKLFQNGQSQAIRLPKEFRFDGGEVYLNKVGATTYILPLDSPWDGFLASLDDFSSDCFQTGRKQPKRQIREDL